MIFKQVTNDDFIIKTEVLNDKSVVLADVFGDNEKSKKKNSNCEC